MQPLPSATPRHLSGTASLVIMKHDSSQDIMACHFYPSTSQLDVNNAQVLWHLAISAVFYRIRRRNLTWDLLKSRRDRRHRHTCRQCVHSLSSEENEGLLRLSDRVPQSADLQSIGYAAMLEPDRFPWILPLCIGCGRLPLRSTVPCLRCCNCGPFHPAYSFVVVFSATTQSASPTIQWLQRSGNLTAVRYALLRSEDAKLGRREWTWDSTSGRRSLRSRRCSSKMPTNTRRRCWIRDGIVHHPRPRRQMGSKLLPMSMNSNPSVELTNTRRPVLDIKCRDQESRRSGRLQCRL